ncbi:MAG: transcriptional regulator [Leifsonia xyli]|nr:MAG: transcriptional regulator [Leifsonia xyli]
MSEPGEKIQMSIRVPAESYEAYGKIASIMDRDRTWVMLRALAQYLEGEGRQILQDAEGFAALDRGEGVDFDEVLAEVDVIISQAERRHAARKPG